MNSKENSYCRLCAETKSRDKLTDLQTDTAVYKEIVNKLSRLNCHLDFKEDILPTTVCLKCVNALQDAYSFVLSIEQAQVQLKQVTVSQSIKLEIESSDSENVVYQTDNIIMKYEPQEEATCFEPKTLNNEANSTKTKQENDISDDITLSQLKLKLNWQDYSWTCSYCGTQFPSVLELKTHAMEYHKACNPHRCTDCNIRKLCLDKFLKHVRRHRKHLQLSCHICHKVFSSPHEAYKHRAEHIGSNFKCVGCNTCFHSLEHRDKHMSLYYKNPQSRNIPIEMQQDNLTCSICKKTYKSKSSLHTHLLIHTERKRDHTCEVCGKCFFHKENLTAHLMLHEDRQFKCEICKISFTTKNILRKHVTVHDGVKPFACEQCGRCFRLKKQLNSHSIVHTDSLPYVCSHCNKGFRFKNVLKLHLRQHTGIKPYTCDICPRDFTNWSNYNKHMKRRHSKDMSKKKHTPNGVYPVDPVTGQVIYPETDKVEWKKKILEDKKSGRSKLIQNNILKSNGKIKK